MFKYKVLLLWAYHVLITLLVISKATKEKKSRALVSVLLALTDNHPKREVYLMRKIR